MMKTLCNFTFGTAMAAIFTFSGLQQGEATVFVSGWTVVDNSFSADPAGNYGETGTWNNDTFNVQWAPNHRYAGTTAGPATSTANWTFLGLTPGIFAVAVSYSWDHNRPIDAPYSINGGTTLGTDLFLVSQDVSTPATGPPTLSGVNFETLTTTYVQTSGTLVVTLSNVSADSPGAQFVIADAVAIQRLADLPPASVPEPTTYAMSLIGLVGLGLFVWRSRRAASLARSILI